MFLMEVMTITMPMFIRHMLQSSQLQENDYINWPTTTAEYIEKDDIMMSFVTQFMLTLYPNYSGTVMSEGAKIDILKPYKIVIETSPNEGLTPKIRKRLIKVAIIPKIPRFCILVEEEPGRIVKANRKNVIDIQNRDVQKVAFYFELKSFNTAKELIHPPQVAYWPAQNMKPKDRMQSSFLGNSWGVWEAYSSLFSKVFVYWFSGVGTKQEKATASNEKNPRIVKEFNQNRQTTKGPRSPPMPKNPQIT